VTDLSRARMHALTNMRFSASLCWKCSSRPCRAALLSSVSLVLCTINARVHRNPGTGRIKEPLD